MVYIVDSCSCRVIGNRSSGKGTFPDLLTKPDMVCCHDRSSYHSFTLRLVLEESIKEATSGGRRSAPAIKDVAEYCDSLMVNFLQEEEIEEQAED